MSTALRVLGVQEPSKLSLAAQWMLLEAGAAHHPVVAAFLRRARGGSVEEEGGYSGEGERWMRLDEWMRETQGA